MIPFISLLHLSYISSITSYVLQFFFLVPLAGLGFLFLKKIMHERALLSSLGRTLHKKAHKDMRSNKRNIFQNPSKLCTENM